MPELHIEDWDPTKSLPQDFLEIPHEIYANDPNWIPESKSDTRIKFSESNNYFLDNSAAIICNKDLRIAGFFNPNLVVDGQKAAFFGFWESRHNLEANQFAFSQIEAWAKSKGAEQIYGPINFSTFGDYRIRIDSFDHPQLVGEPYNPDYYPEILEALGYKIRYKYLTACCTSETLAKAGKQKLPECKATADALGLELKPLSPEFWMANLEQLYPIVDSIFSENFAYSKISFEQFKSFCGKKFASKFCPETSNVLLDNNEIVAFSLFYPDYSPLVVQGAKNPLPVDELNYDRHFQLLPSPRTCLMKTLGVAPKYRSKGLLYYGAFYGSIQSEKLYTYSYGAMVREDNHSSVVTNFSSHLYHYGLYTKAL